MPKKAKSNDETSPNPTKGDYERLGQTIESIFVSGHYDKLRLYRMSFLRGVFQGLGSVVGATIVIALLLWILSALEALPLIGGLFESVQDSVEQ